MSIIFSFLPTAEERRMVRIKVNKTRQMTRRDFNNAVFLELVSTGRVEKSERLIENLRAACPTLFENNRI